MESKKSRKNSRYAHQYKRYPSIRDKRDGFKLCLFCGEKADTVDHVPPITRVDDHISLFGRQPLFLVDCCNECNGLLGDSLQLDIEERGYELQKRLKKEYAPAMRVAHHTPAELAELKPMLRASVEAGMQMKVLYRRRAKWLGFFNTEDPRQEESEKELQLVDECEGCKDVQSAITSYCGHCGEKIPPYTSRVDDLRARKAKRISLAKNFS